MNDSSGVTWATNHDIGRSKGIRKKPMRTIQLVVAGELMVFVALFGLVQITGCEAKVRLDDLGDTDTDTETDGDPLPPAWFLMDAARIGDTDEGCDLDGDDEVDNQFSVMATFMADEGYLDEHLNDSIATDIDTGEFLIVISLTDLNDMIDDASISTSLYDGKLEDQDAGVPDDLYSGHGTVLIEDAANAMIEDSTIASSHLSMLVGEITIALSINSNPIDITIYNALLSADIDPLPDEEMLEGGMTAGTICGSVDWSDLADGLALILELEQTEQMTLSAYLKSIADIDCEDTDCKQISIGLLFSAVSVIATDP